MIRRLLIIAAFLIAVSATLPWFCFDEGVEVPRPSNAPRGALGDDAASATLDPLVSAENGSARERLLAAGLTSEASSYGASIAGTVITVGGEPAPGVTVAFYGQDTGEDPLKLASSGADGRFQASGLEPGTYWLGAASAGADAIQTRVEVRSGESLRAIHVVTYGFKTLTGHLTGPQGEPVAGAKLYLDVAGDDESAYLRWNSPSRATLTDENGAFRFEDVPRLPVDLGVYPSHYTTENVRVAPDVEVADVVFRGKDENVVVLGRVLDPSGAPVPAAEVALKGLTRNLKGITDDAGRFSFETAMSGEPDTRGVAIVEAWAPRFAPARIELPVENGRAGPVDLKLREAYALEGTVVNAAGQPIRAGLTLYEAGKSLHDPSLIRLLDARFHKSTVEDGFRVEHLWGADFDVVIQVGSETHSIHRLDPRDGPFVLGPRSDDRQIIFEVTARNAITHEPLMSYSLGTYGKGGGASRGGNWVDGVARDSEKGPATLEVRVKAKGYAPALVRRRHFDPGTYRLEVSLLPVRSVRLRAVDINGLPLRGLHVRFPEVALTEGELNLVAPAGGGTTEIDGRCWLDNVPVTIESLEVFDEGGEVRVATHRLPPADATQPVTLSSAERTIVIRPL